mgnify:CR=1 FL=1
MGFIKAFTGAMGGTFADQWKDFYVPQPGVPATAGIFPAVPQGTNHGRGENTKGNKNIITNGSKIVVPEGTALITMQDGAITGIIAEAGGFEFRADDINSKSIFAGDAMMESLLHSTWEKVWRNSRFATVGILCESERNSKQSLRNTIRNLLG